MSNEEILEWNKNLAELLPMLKINENGKYSNLRYKNRKFIHWFKGDNISTLPAKWFEFSPKYIYEVID